MKVNGETVRLSKEANLSDWLSANGYDASRSAVLLNGKVVPKDKLAATMLSDVDCVEIVSFVGGG